MAIYQNSLPSMNKQHQQKLVIQFTQWTYGSVLMHPNYLEWVLYSELIDVE